MTQALQVQDLYSHAKDVRGTFGGDEQRATQYFNDYVQFVRRASPPGRGTPHKSVLDIGCGAGWSSFLFARHGYTATGIDLNAQAFEPPPTPGLTLLEASGLEIPFGDELFDVVTAYQTLEHIPDPQAALLEMLRVCKTGGVLCIVGPNCLSLLQSVTVLRHVVRNRPIKNILFRTEEMPRHPFGDTLPEALTALPRNVGRILQKSLSSKAHFSMREPDTKPPFHADNDACYLCNPLDLTRFLSGNGCALIRNGAYGRSPLTTMIASGTWIAARKRAKRR